MRISGRFSSREMVDWEHRSRPDGSRSSAILNTGSACRLVASLASSCRDHQQSEADDVSQCVQRATGIASILGAGGQTLGHREPPFDLTQQQQTAVGGQTAAVEPGDHFFPGNR